MRRPAAVESAPEQPGESAAATAATTATAAPSFGANRERLKMFEALGADFAAKGWAPAREVLREVRAVPTWFPQVDRILKVGGWPTDRVTLVHGDSNGGKTAFGLGLLGSFLAHDHFGAFIDAEQTTPLKWARELLGALVDHPAFQMLPAPTTYEQTVDLVRAWATTIGEARVKGRIPADITGLLLLDSIRKLVPKRLLDRLLKEGAGGDDDEPEDAGRRGRRPKAAGVDGMNGMAARYKAALNSAWMDELTLLLKQCGVGLVIIGREYEETDTGPMTFSLPDYKLGGGRALKFEPSARVRIVKVGVVKDSETMVGERHRVELHKTKVGQKEEKIPAGYFHTSNGLLVPAGFDRARDVLEIGEEHGVVERSGAWYAFEGERLGQGESAAVKLLSERPELLARIEHRVRADFMPVPAQQGAAGAPAAPRAAKPRAKKPSARKGPKRASKGARK